MVTLMGRALKSYMERGRTGEKEVERVVVMMAASTRRNYSLNNQFNILMLNIQIAHSELRAHFKDTKEQFDFYKNSVAKYYLAMKVFFSQLEPLEVQLKQTEKPSPYTIDGSNVAGPKLPLVLTKKMVKSRWMACSVPASVKPGFYFVSHCD